MTAAIEPPRPRRDIDPGVTDVIPRDELAEQIVIGAAILDPSIIDACHQAGLQARHFWKPAHETLWTIATQLAATDTLEPGILAAELQRRGEILRVGGAPYLHTCIATVPTTANAPWYAQRIRTLARQRDLINLGHRLAQIGTSPATDDEDVTQAHEAALRELVAGIDDPITTRHHTRTVDEFLNTSDTEYDWLIPGTIERHDRLMLTGPEGGGKALALDTPIPTPAGWRTMGDMVVGDQVFDEHGRPCTVTATTPVMHNHQVFAVRFDDGTVIHADADHQWLTHTVRARESARAARTRGPLRPRGTDQTAKRTTPAVVTTAEIRATLRVRSVNVANHSIPVADALQFPVADLPIDPYVLGAWLGDGSTAGGRITTADPEIIEQIRAAGYEVRPGAGKYGYGIQGLQKQLRALGVLGAKHIPAIYKQASPAQRQALLQGLMDTDGTINVSGKAELTLCSQRLADDAFELIISLGHKATINTSDSTLNGRVVGTRHRICFRPADQIFRLPRKAARHKNAVNDTSRHRYIVACDPIPSVPVRCIQVDSPSHLYLAGRTMIPTHNSTFFRQLAIMSAAGIHPFTGETFTPIRVLLLDLENSERQIRRKLRPLRHQAGELLQPERLYIECRPRGLDLLQPADQRWLQDLVADVKPDLLMTGPIYRMASGDPTEEKTAKPVSATLDSIRDHGCALAIEAHVAKAASGTKRRPREPYGASLWLRWPEFGVFLDRDGTIEDWRGQRDEREWPAMLTRGGEWPWTPSNDPAALLWARIKQARHHFGEPMTVRDLEITVGQSKSSIHRCLQAHDLEWQTINQGRDQ